jgi:predicted flap endonuclease-1-like 5' DNA nuclease
MASNTEGLICAAVSWGVALVAGAIAAAVLMVLGGWTLLQAAFVGLIVFIALGALLSLTMCRPLGPPASQTASKPARAHAPAAAPAAPAAHAAPAAAPAPAPAPAPKPAPAPAATEASGPGTRPAALDGPRDGGADDLKRIKGIGPKLEKLCNSLGFWHFDQIAEWTADEVAWVDQNLEGFKGRVTRDSWVAQARLLASGGETEFSQRVDKGDVY